VQQQQQQQPTLIETLPQTELSQSPDLLRHIPAATIPASSRSVSSDQLPRRATRGSTTSAVPTISCPYYKSELYIVSEEQAFRSQQGRPFRNDDVADCVAVASSTPPPSVTTVPHRSCLRDPGRPLGPHRSQIDSGQPADYMMRHSYSGSVLPSSTSGATASSVSAGASSLTSSQRNWPMVGTGRQSLTESKWNWLHSNAMSPQQPSPISLRRATRLDVPSTSAQSASPSRGEFRHQSAGGRTAATGRRPHDGRPADDTHDLGTSHASRMYYSKPVHASSAPADEQPHQHRRTALNLVPSDVHRSVNDKSVRHWRHSSDNTARRSTVDASGSKWDNYGLTLSLSGAAVPPRSVPSLGNGARKPTVDLTTAGPAAASAGDLPNRLPIERIMPFEDSDVLDRIGHQLPSVRHHPKDHVSTVYPQNKPDVASTKRLPSSEIAMPQGSAQSGHRSGRLSIPDSIPIYFRADASAVETKASHSESKTGSRREPLSTRSSHSSASRGMYILVIVVLLMVNTPSVCNTVCVHSYIAHVLCSKLHTVNCMWFACLFFLSVVWLHGYYLMLYTHAPLILLLFSSNFSCL